MGKNLSRESILLKVFYIPHWFNKILENMMLNWFRSLASHLSGIESCATRLDAWNPNSKDLDSDA